tara:strand:+ start:866 stop:1378 length:513 start_codon:yes stop_codon:yes gene_type:complete
MATRKVVLTGIGEWAKVFEDNRDMKGFEGAWEEFNGACTIDMILDDENMQILRNSKSMKKGTPDPEGRGTKVRLIRKFDTGRDWDSGAPVVTKSDGSKWNYEEDGTIGNGSTVQVTLSVYDTSRKGIVGTRLDRIKVINHVEYQPEDEDEVAPPPPPRVVSDNSAKEVLF